MENRWVLIKFSLALFLIGFSCPMLAEELKKEVDVYYFYDRAINHPTTGNPNWFYYWSQFIPKGRIGSLVYDDSIRVKYNAYGATNSSTRITSISSLAGGYNDETGHRGLHAFYEVVAHEKQHLILWDERWPNGYQPAEDTDHDLYPDLWEISHSAGDPFEFVVGRNDRYVDGEPQSNGSSAGYNYEERIFRAREHAINERLFDAQDWSHDPTGLDQGKMWLALP